MEGMGVPRPMVDGVMNYLPPHGQPGALPRHPNGALLHHPAATAMTLPPAPPPPSAAPEPAAGSLTPNGKSGSRIYRACVHCRQRKSKCEL